jgi:RNA polymerase sigma factor (sigma-70 family)
MTVGTDTAEAAWGGEFEAFYARQLPRMLRYCLMLGLPSHAAQDVTQEAFVQVLRRWPTIDDHAAYLRTTAYHLAIKRPVEEPAPDLAGHRRAPQIVPELAGLEERHAIVRACQQLSCQRQAVFALHYDGYRDGEIAAILGMNPVTVRSHLRHARENLRAWWDREGNDSPGRRGQLR